MPNCKNYTYPKQDKMVAATARATGKIWSDAVHLLDINLDYVLTMSTYPQS